MSVAFFDGLNDLVSRRKEQANRDQNEQHAECIQIMGRFVDIKKLVCAEEPPDDRAQAADPRQCIEPLGHLDPRTDREQNSESEDQVQQNWINVLPIVRGMGVLRHFVPPKNDHKESDCRTYGKHVHLLRHHAFE